jgi:carbamoyl-phosphate synthase small subunit
MKFRIILWRFKNPWINWPVIFGFWLDNSISHLCLLELKVLEFSTRMDALLVLEDGYSERGVAFGYAGNYFGEIVFNTCITGYQEILTDPSYQDQIIVFTYPQIGNYGINTEDVESSRIYASAIVVRELSNYPSNWRSNSSLADYLKYHGKLAIAEIDTRALTRHIRDKGAMRCGISTRELDVQNLLQKVRSIPQMEGADLVPKVTTPRSYEINSNANASWNVVVYDYGTKGGILRHLVEEKCRLTVVPAGTPAEQVIAMKPHGVVLSNGPGDPAALAAIIDEVKKLIGKFPILGICLGHQILAHALGGKTYKLKFGHRGGNQPVLHVPTQRVEITSHNHGFAVDPDSLGSGVQATYFNLNDNTLEGFRCQDRILDAVQFHPEASPGPHDCRHIFSDFSNLMKSFHL